MEESYTQQYEQFELRHWWFVARREIIKDFMEKYGTQGDRGLRWLDVGCGTGVLLHSMGDFKNKMGLEVHRESVAAAQAKGLNVEAAVHDLDLAPYGRFGLITLCDVLEHIEDDRSAIDKLHAALEDNGVILLTVPALMSLWSEHDLINHHFRRYRAGSLAGLLAKDRWTIERVSYFSSLLLPLIWLVRTWNKIRGKKCDAAGDLKMGPAWLDAILLAIFRLEKVLLRFVRLPLGSSLILVARKK